MTQPSLPRPVFVKRKPSSKRRRRTEIPSPPHSPDNDVPIAPSSQPSQTILARPAQPRRSQGRVMRAQDLVVTPTSTEQPAVDYSAQSLQRLREAQSIRPPPSSTDKQAVHTSHTPEIEVPEINRAKPGTEASKIASKSQEPAPARPSPFTTAWNPIAGPDELAIEDKPDLSFLPTLEGSNSDDGWEASQLARGGGKADGIPFTYIVRSTEQTVPTKGHVATLKSALVQARKEWESRELIAGESAQRTAKAVENAMEIIEDADKLIREREAVVAVYEDVLEVFTRVCELLKKEKETLQGYRKKVLQRLENEAKLVKVRLLGGEDEFGRSVPGRLTEVDDDYDERTTIYDLETEGLDVGFDPEEIMDEVIEAVNKWKTTDMDGFTNGFGAQGGGRVIGRLGLAFPNTAWLETKLTKEVRKSALETGEVGKLVGEEIRAKWEPRRKDGFKEWAETVVLVKDDVIEAIRERFGWEVDACAREADKAEAERCVRGCLEVLRFGLDPGIVQCLDKLRDILGEQFCEGLDEEVARNVVL